MNLLIGVCGSKGYSSGEAVVKTTIELALAKTRISDADAEIQRFRDAQSVFDARLTQLSLETKKAVGSEASKIFEAYRGIVHDEDFFKNAFDRVTTEKINIEYAVKRECEKIIMHFDSMDNAYMKERAADIENICTELIHIMMGIKNKFANKISGKTDVILIANDLTPSETVKLDKSVLRGIVTERGGVTSHTVILAKALGIPVIVGASGAVEAIQDGDFIQIDAFSGKVFVNPDKKSRKDFMALQSLYNQRREQHAKAAYAKAVTKDGFSVNVSINSGDPETTRGFTPDSCDGIGLFRTEYIYMDSPSYPDEEVQFEIYRGIAARANGKPVVIRTLDIGGDKQACYMNLPVEETPALGYRGIRICLDKRDVFAVQLRAILRASAFGNIKILLPMIVCMEELMDAKACLEAEKQRLLDDGIPFNGEIPVGIMIETPAAVLLSDKLARESAFFSVGSNDLTQYTTAADRANELVRKLHDSCNISVLRLIKIVSDNAARAGIPWSICGEAASEERLVPLWIAMGVSELSVVPSDVGEIKHIIGNINRNHMQNELGAILDFDRIDKVKEHLDALSAGI